MFKQKTDEKNIEFLIDITEDFPNSITIDEIRIRQILLNLIGNAVKFTSTGYIKIKVEIIKSINSIIDFSISVKDSGIGIAVSDKDKIFESFSQQSGHDTKKYGGTGLGLAITKRLCELMNGRIDLKSKIGKGSEFIITFSNIKYSDKVINHDNDYSWNAETIVFKNSKVLVVDDVINNRELVLSYLEKYDLTLFEAEDGEQAIRSAKEYLPELILMDLRMPIMNGYEATKELKRIVETKPIPVIALTASIMQSEDRSVNDLFDGYIRKPVQKKSLINEMIKFLPHQMIEEKLSDEQEMIDITVDTENISDVIKETFKKEFFEKLDYVNDVMMIDDINAISDQMIKFAESNDLKLLKTISNDLKVSIAEFDFDRISQDIGKIKEFFK